MPGPTVHLRLVRDTVERWRHDDAAPVDLDAPDVMDALHAGAVAPDSGYYPGASPFLTDLAHYIRTGALTRNLVAEAATDVERAFAWGWASHVTADRLLHPVINRAVADLLGEPAPLTFADRPEAHIRVEMGLEAFFDARYGTPPLRDPLGDRTWFVAQAYERTYDVRIPPTTFQAAFAAAARYHRPLRLVTRLNHAAFPDRGVPPRLAAAALVAGRLLVRALAGGSTIPALFRAVEPTGTFLAAVERAAVEYHADMDRCLADGLAALPDYNLDTGTADEAARQYELATMTERQLNKYRGT